MAVNINRQKLVLGGLAAGLVLNIIDFLSNGVIFSARMQADANAFKAGLGDQMAAMGGEGAMAAWALEDPPRASDTARRLSSTLSRNSELSVPPAMSSRMRPYTGSRTARAAIAARTLRTDRWWLAPLITVVGLGGWVAYATVRVLPPLLYGEGHPYAMPFSVRRSWCCQL